MKLYSPVYYISFFNIADSELGVSRWFLEEYNTLTVHVSVEKLGRFACVVEHVFRR